MKIQKHTDIIGESLGQGNRLVIGQEHSEPENIIPVLLDVPIINLLPPWQRLHHISKFRLHPFIRAVPETQKQGQRIDIRTIRSCSHRLTILGSVLPGG
jgi:hypothetical protein